MVHEVMLACDAADFARVQQSSECARARRVAPCCMMELCNAFAVDFLWATRVTAAVSGKLWYKAPSANRFARCTSPFRSGRASS